MQLPHTLFHRQRTRVNLHVSADTTDLHRPLLVTVGEPMAIAGGSPGWVCLRTWQCGFVRRRHDDSDDRSSRWGVVKQSYKLTSPA